MFPQSLQKNIRELDKQITLLESECENMSTDKRKTGNVGKMSLKEGEAMPSKTTRDNAERRPNTTPLAATRIVKKSPRAMSTTIVNSKNIAPSTGAIKKVVTTKETSTTTNELSKVKAANAFCRTGRPHSGRKKSAVTADKACRRLINQGGDSHINKNLDLDTEKHAVHKDVPVSLGGVVTVPVAQKPAAIQSNTIKGQRAGASMKNGGEDKIELGSFIAKADIKLPTLPESSLSSQKWSEILCQTQHDDFLKKYSAKVVEDSNIKSSDSLGSKYKSYYGAVPKARGSATDSQFHTPSMKLNKDDRMEVGEMWNDENLYPQSAIATGQRMPRPKSPFRGKNIENIIDISPRTIRHYDEKGIKSSGDEKSSISDESFDPIRTMCHLIEALKENFNGDDAKKLLKQLELSLVQLMEEWPMKNAGKDKVDYVSQVRKQESEYVKKLQKHFLNTQKLCDELTKEKNKLSEDLAMKEHLLQTLNSKEKEYLSVITNLKMNLEKKRFLVEENLEALKELNVVKNELLKETKVGEGLRKSHWKMQEEIQKCMLENDKLKTEIRLKKLEAQKFHFLLAGKDAEIRKYKQDVLALQRQISDQLITLRSNRGGNEVQKAMAAIMKQSEALSITDGESLVSEPQSKNRDGTNWKQKERLMHSSPTSRNSSVGDSLWNRISSIRGEELKSNGGSKLKTNEEDELSNEENEELNSNDENNEVLVGASNPRRQTSSEDHPKVQSFASCNSDYSSDDSVGEVDRNDEVRREIHLLLEELQENCRRNVITHPDCTVEINEDAISAGTADIRERLLAALERRNTSRPADNDLFVPLMFY